MLCCILKKIALLKLQKQLEKLIINDFRNLSYSIKIQTAFLSHKSTFILFIVLKKLYLCTRLGDTVIVLITELIGNSVKN